VEFVSTLAAQVTLRRGSTPEVAFANRVRLLENVGRRLWEAEQERAMMLVCQI
jgi:hypothetical protein